MANKMLSFPRQIRDYAVGADDARNQDLVQVALMRTPLGVADLMPPFTEGLAAFF